MDILLGLLTPVFVYILVLLLYWVLPARRVTGYVNDPNTGQPYQYRLNGVLVLLSIVSVWTLVCHLSLMPWDWFYQIRWWSLAGAGAVGLAYTSVLVMQVPHNDTSIWADLIYGRIENRQYANKVDVKMHLYLSAVVMLCLNVLSFAAHHSLTFGGIVNPGVFLYALLFIFMLFDCVIFERAHLYTYDLSKARLGLKLVLGCLVFYPYFLVAGLWATAELAAPSIHNDGLWLALAASVFFCGWVLARGANLQKYYFKRFPTRRFLFWQPESISNGRQKLLCNGFWGVSRHINYLGTMLMVTGLALSLGHFNNPWVWSCPAYCITSLLLRRWADDKRCADKYGSLWDAYRAQVRYKIIPGLY